MSTTTSSTSPKPGAARALRGIIHCHSRYSHDSATRVRSYLRAAERENLDFVILTDHDTTAGALALQRAAAKRIPNLQVPIAAEYLTDQGDVIAAFLTEEIRARTFVDFVTEARAQGGMLLLPHPYVGHPTPERVAKECDLIETVNCRTRQLENQRAMELARSLGKPSYSGTDSHFARSIASALVEIEDLGNLKESLLRGEITSLPARFTSRWEYGASQLIKAWKRRDAKLARRLLMQTIRQLSEPNKVAS